MRPTGCKNRAVADSAAPRCAATTPLYAIAGADGMVLHSRLRGGNSHTARGADGFLGETFSRVRAAGVTGPLQVRGDSGFYSKKVVAACQKAGAGWSITVKLDPNIDAAISKMS